MTKTVEYPAFYELIFQREYPLENLVAFLIESCQDLEYSSVIPVIEIFIFFITLPFSELSEHFNKTIDLDCLMELIAICDDIEDEEVAKKRDFFKDIIDCFYGIEDSD